jgi:predicted nucleic acid-binding protein
MQTASDEQFALDACSISFILRKDKQIVKAFEQAKRARKTIVIPPTTWYEVRRGLLWKDATHKLRDFEAMCEQYPVVIIDNFVLEEAAKIYVELLGKKWNVDENDLYLAAFCKLHDLTLVTNNTKHFEQIDGLKLADWMQE